MTQELEILAAGRFSRFVKRGCWEFMERINRCGAVIVLAVTDANRLILVEQYRPPLDRRVIELPAGLAGDLPEFEGEALAEAARRELLEETGYRAERMTYLMDGPPSPAMNNEILTFFRAEELCKVSAGGGDETEDIRVHEAPLDALESWLAARREEGRLVDPKIYSALYFLK